MRRALLIIFVVILAACSTRIGPNPTSPPETPGEFEQTWTKPYRITTCGDWVKKMDSHQRFVMAGDMLFSARKSDGDDELPPESMIRDFAKNIGLACKGAGVKLRIKVPEVAASLYVMSSDYKP